MPGRLRSSFRSGNLAEHLGLLLLKGVAAIAEVSRPEDIGLDAVATLLRSDDDGNCYAEDSFVVQIKADSATTLEYRGHELKWFIGQTLPMFIGLVSLAESQISLYPTLFINQSVLALDPEKVTSRFGRSSLAPFLAGQMSLPWTGGADKSVTVWLGEALLRWSLRDLTDPDWAKRSYEILKRFLGLAHRERELLSLGQCSALEWSTNDLNSIKSNPAMMKGHPDELKAIAERGAPLVKALMLRAMSTNSDAGNELMVSLLTMVKSLRKMGVEIDPEDMFGKLFPAFRKPSHESDGKITT